MPSQRASLHDCRTNIAGPALCCLPAPRLPQLLDARFLTTFATQIVSVAVGWQMYDLTRDPFDLGLVASSSFLPSLLLVLVTGVVADRFGRRLIMALAALLEAICALALLL